MAILAATPLEYLLLLKATVPVVLLALFWSWESWRPFFGQPAGRWRHAAANLAVALFNTLVLGLAFGTLTLTVATWTAEDGLGLLNAVTLATPLRFAAALLLLDGWMYLWHRANHTFPLLWRFHRMHHSDTHMDVTTATRFHVGEHVGSALARLALIPLLGLEVWQLIAYDTLVIALTQFHHADISLGRWDRWLRLVVVTPDLHKVHHSEERAETDSNFSTVLSVWDRLARTLRVREDARGIMFGLPEFAAPLWQTWWGMLRTPFVGREAGGEPVLGGPVPFTTRYPSEASAKVAR
jgi:sterol desaturase/sphingolipid hydroxylase (fatty acid hydroxylase superfamily)